MRRRVIQGWRFGCCGMKSVSHTVLPCNGFRSSHGGALRGVYKRFKRPSLRCDRSCCILLLGRPLLYSQLINKGRERRREGLSTCSEEGRVVARRRSDGSTLLLNCAMKYDGAAS